MTYAIKKDWIKKQMISPLHIGVVLGFCLLHIFGGYINILTFNLLEWAYIIIFFITGVPKALNIIVASIVIGLILAFLPPLGIGITIVFFLLRLSSIYQHRKALLVGLLFYGHWVIPRVFPYYYSRIFGDIFLFSYKLMVNFSMFFWAVFYALMLHFMLVWLYKNKYSTSSALATMGAAPIYLIMLIMPFVANEIADFIDFSDYESFNGSSNGHPGYHTVRGHLRETPTGHTTVRGHIRTNPDGIESNNLSYKK